MKTVPIHLEDEEFKKVVLVKGSRTWREFILESAGLIKTQDLEEETQDEDKQEYLY